MSKIKRNFFLNRTLKSIKVKEMSKKTIGIFLKTGFVLLALKNKLLTFVLNLRIIKTKFKRFVKFKNKNKKEIIEKFSNEIIRICKNDSYLPKELQLNMKFNLTHYTKIQNRLVEYLFNLTFLEYITDKLKFSNNRRFRQEILKEAIIKKFPEIHNYFLITIQKNEKFDRFLKELKKIELKRIEEIPKKKAIFKIILNKKITDKITFQKLDKNVFLKQIQKILENVFFTYSFKRKKDFILKLLFIIVEQKNNKN